MREQVDVQGAIQEMWEQSSNVTSMPSDAARKDESYPGLTKSEAGRSVL